MPSTRDIQRRVERLEQANTPDQTRFTFNVETLISLLGEDGLKPSGSLSNDLTQQLAQHGFATDRQ